MVTMGRCISTASRRQPTGRISQGTISGEPTGVISQGSISGKSKRKRYASLFCYTYWPVSEYGVMCNRPQTISSIHILDDDSLLHVFYLCQPIFSGEDDFVGHSFSGWGSNEHWWYTLAHVCQGWRKIILRSATYLGLSLACSYGTPVADMLANSPPLPLVVGYYKNDRELTADEEGIIIVLKQHGRVRRLRLSNAITIMKKLYAIMDEEYPILEVLYITRQIEDNSTIFTFPESFQAPHLRHLTLRGFALPIGSRLLTSAVGLVTLDLDMAHPSTYFHPNTLIQWISLMLHLKMLKIVFQLPIPNRELERQLTNTSIITPITLPNLHCLHFRGVSTYLESLVHRITAPRLEELQIEFFSQLTFSLPRVPQFINTIETPRFDSARVVFSDNLAGAAVYTHGETVDVLSIVVKCQHLDWQVTSMAQICNSPGQIISAVERLLLQLSVHRSSSGEHNVVDRTEWRKLLRPFSNVKTLRIYGGIVKDLSHCLELEDGEFPLELLPELRELEYRQSRKSSDVFTSFIDARRNSGRPVTLVHL